MKKLTDYPDAHLRVFERPPLPEAIRDIYLIGISGTGMGTLAGLLKEAGFQVRGSDAAAYPPMSTLLQKLGIPVYEGFDPAHLIPPPDVVIVGNACTPTHPEAAYAREQRLPQLSLPEALRYFFLQHRRPLVVAGTHGKTTTTGLLAHLFEQGGAEPGYFIGGLWRDGRPGYAVGKGKHFILEGDEYDSAYFDKRPKFWHYMPHGAIVTSVEFDHADIYEDEEDYYQAFAHFVSLLPEEGLLVLFGDDARVRSLAAHTRARVMRYGLEEDNDITVREVITTTGGQRFRLIIQERELGTFFLPLSGRHNLLNAMGALGLALDEGIPVERLQEALPLFPGMKRRQEVLAEINGILVIDDFAHHPTAVRETIRAIRMRYPERRLIVLFEPRSNTSRRKRFEAAYAQAFDEADRVFLRVPPLRHNDDPADFIDAFGLAQQITHRGTSASTYSDVHTLLPEVLRVLQPGDVVLIMSNGGFDHIQERLLQALRALPVTSERSEV